MTALSRDAPTRSPLWYRVAGLRPRLAARARLHRHQYRGEVWYLLQDPASSRTHRFTPGARLVLTAMDGQRSVQQLWELAQRQLGPEAPTQDEMIQLLGQLHATDLLMADVQPDALELFTRGERERRQRQQRMWRNPLALRLPVLDPGPFLDRTGWLWRRVWSRAGAALWLLAVLPACLLLPAHWAELTGNWSDRVLQADNLLLLLVVFPVLKLLHEMGHATAAHAAGGEVHDMGVMLLVLMPVPYVDASSANVLRSRWARARIGAAGMLVELFVAALAFYLWLMVEPGLARAVLFNVMLVAGVSTLVFNGNPLLRYDAYYILADLAELPNLAVHAARHWGHLLQRHLFGIADSQSPARHAAERRWFLVFGLLSSAYRLLVALTIALYIGSRFFFLGILLAVWALVAMVLLPLGKALKALHALPATQERPGRIYRRLLLAIAVPMAIALLLPLPSRTVAEGVVWLPEEAIVRAGAPGFLRHFDGVPGDQVVAGQLLATSVDPALEAQLALAQARVRELQARVQAVFMRDPAEAAILREQLRHEQSQLARAEERTRGLQVLAGSSGQLVVDRPADLVGGYLRQGDVIGHVIGPAAPVIRVALDQAAVEPVARATRTVQLRPAGAADQPWAARILRQVPPGSSSVSNQALTATGGGRLMTDPRDPEGRRTLERVFELDLALLDPQAPVWPYGHRVHVRFDHPPEPLAQQAWRALRRLLLRHFDV